MRGFVRLIVLVVIAAAAAAAAYELFVYEPPVGPIPPPQREGFDPALAAHGGQLAAIGSYGIGNTAPSGREFATSTRFRDLPIASRRERSEASQRSARGKALTAPAVG